MKRLITGGLVRKLQCLCGGSGTIKCPRARAGWLLRPCPFCRGSGTLYVSTPARMLRVGPDTWLRDKYKGERP